MNSIKNNAKFIFNLKLSVPPKVKMLTYLFRLKFINKIINMSL